MRIKVKQKCILHNEYYLSDVAKALDELPDDYVDLVVTSPPYDDLRTYHNNYSFDVQSICEKLMRVLKEGAVVVWIVGDATVDGSETGTSFRQALAFKSCGFLLHDTMIWDKGSYSAVGSLKYRYGPVFEYMFVFSKGRPKTFNPIKDRENKCFGQTFGGTVRLANGNTVPNSAEKAGGKVGHPAAFPLQIPTDHIRTWTNEGDTVMDIFGGSGQTGIAANSLQRNFVYIDVDPTYFELGKSRIEKSR